MSKELSEMTLEELWQLFPIVLSENRACWAEWYKAEAERITARLPAEQIRVSHIGSTAIGQIKAKPIVDILLEIPQGLSMQAVKTELVSIGYTCMCEEANRVDFNMGYTKTGFAEKVFHLHLRCMGDNDELYFRDYMNDNPSLAKEYEQLKLSLQQKYEHNRDAYTSAKGSFIRQHTLAAKELYGKRY